MRSGPEWSPKVIANQHLNREVLDVKKLYRSKRKLAEALQKLNNHLACRFGIPQSAIPRAGGDDASAERAGLDDLMSAAAVARYLGLSTKTLANWRSSGLADLPYVQVGSRIFYKTCDVNAFVARASKRSTSEGAK